MNTQIPYLFKLGASEAAEGCLASVAAKLVKTATKIIFTNIQIYMRVEINRAGKFGPFLLRFGALPKMTSRIYIRVEINRACKFGPFLLRFSALPKVTFQIYIRVEINHCRQIWAFFVAFSCDL